jgi:CheY-like chemotaxis protein
MASYRVLIVDDQTDIRRMLRIGVENLGPDFSVFDMPSGEEALLESMGRPVDLLISDIRLPGISGLELVSKIRRRDPHLKIILITALTDARTRRQAADSGANAFFTKPLDMPDFLDTVERLLGIVETFLPPPPIVPREPLKDPFTPVDSLAGQLCNLRKDLAASAVVLLDGEGRVLAQAGALTEIVAQAPGLVAALMTTFSASSKISQALGVKTPRSLMFFPGSQHSLCLAHVGASCALLAALGPGDEQASAAASGVINAAIEDLLISLSRLDAPQMLSLVEAIGPQPGQDGPAALTETPLSATGTELNAEKVEEVSKLFEAYTKKPNTKDLNHFWETAVEENVTNGLGDGGAISYEQAKKLGLAPEDG